jgi:DNA-binding HxlR family transcriptional regulator
MTKSNNNGSKPKNKIDTELKSDCAMWFVTDIIGQKWSIPILIELINASSHEKSSLSYTDLVELLPEISSRTLTRRLEFLVATGMIERLDNKTTPKKVRYKLSLAASELVIILADLRLWSVKFGDVENSLCKNNICRHAVSLDSFIKELPVL